MVIDGLEQKFYFPVLVRLFELGESEAVRTDPPTRVRTSHRYVPLALIRLVTCPTPFRPPPTSTLLTVLGLRVP